jgi:diguanylate cyclase (GGDEF)-like protein/hemerythrin-like metal-binding protein
VVTEDDPQQTVAREGLVRMVGLLSLLMPAGAGIGFGVKGLDGNYRLANETMERLLGGAGGILAGKPESAFLPAALSDRLARCDRQIIAGSPAVCADIELVVDGRSSPCRWLKLPVVGPDQQLQWITSLLYERSAPVGEAALRQTLDGLQAANQELRRELALLEQAASTDKLTGAWNRRRLEECVRVEIDRLDRHQHPVSLLIIDIDFFKAINDQKGHQVGDQVLLALSLLLQKRLRSADSLARWGGEEFVVLCPNTRRTAAAVLGERLRAEIAAQTFPAAIQLSVSIGIAECRPGECWEQWFERADEALYRAKNGGRNQIQLAPETGQAVSEEGYVVANFVQLVWHSAYECGDERVDRGHRQLFSDTNELLSAILSGQAGTAVDTIIDRLFADIRQHFRDEEVLIVAAGFPGAEAHIVLHRHLVTQALALIDDYRAGRQGVGDVFQFLAHDVVAKHLLGEDRKFFTFLRPAGVAVGTRGEERLGEGQPPPDRRLAPAITRNPS